MYALIVLVLLLPIHGAQTSPSNPQNGEKHQTKKTGSKQYDQTTNTPQAAGASHQPAEPEPSPTQQQYDPYSDSLYRAYLWATVIGVIGGAIGLGFLIIQTIATKTAANAAKESADIAMDAQRSWFLVKHVKEPDMNAVWLENFTYVFEVIGSSPVRVIESKFIFDLFDGRPSKHNSKIREADLPATPVYGEPDTLSAIPTMGMILSTGEGPHVVVRLKTGILTPEQLTQLQRWEKFACCYGFVRYRDAFSKAKIRETRFCFIYDVPQGLIPPDRTKENPNSFRVGGPPAYNDVT